MCGSMDVGQKRSKTLWYCMGTTENQGDLGGQVLIYETVEVPIGQVESLHYLFRFVSHIVGQDQVFGIVGDCCNCTTGWCSIPDV